MFCCLPAIIAPFGLLLMAFWIWMIVEVATKEPAEDNDKIMWLLIVLLCSWIGAAIYFFVRRPERIRKYGR